MIHISAYGNEQEIPEEGGEEPEVSYNFPQLTKMPAQVQFETAVALQLEDIQAEISLLVPSFVSTPKNCSFCEEPVAFPFSECPKGHKFSKCFKTFLPVTEPGISRRCDFCQKLFLDVYFPNEPELSSQDENQVKEFGWVVVEGLGFRQCPCCGGNTQK